MIAIISVSYTEFGKTFDELNYKGVNVEFNNETALFFTNNPDTDIEEALRYCDSLAETGVGIYKSSSYDDFIVDYSKI